ncbi:short-chain dehydrogenase/reductase family protein [Fusarium austroafricanum]|uniref:Short-chain dehydrogenase/reductase family protein n=1 Tax=Fusarium austroafricanum TaxID=2364996 RepID=A0A8H4KCD1_9HYPO|nr:short-chain dehydrogenase/reductase family protein [Fusarium austroafricanum]
MKIFDFIISKLVIRTPEPKPRRHGRGILRSLMAPVLPSPPYSPKSFNLSGRVALVTGTTSGLGLETCRHLLTQGVAKLIMSARYETKGSKPGAWNWNRTVILNAACLTEKRALSEYTRHEKMLQANYFSTALLCILLLPALKGKSPAGKPGQLTVVSIRKSSLSHYKPPKQSFFDYFEDIEEKHGLCQKMDNKILEHMFVKELAKQVPCDYVIVNVVDPGRNGSCGLEHKTDKKVQREKLWEETLQEFESIVGDLDIDRDETGCNRLGQLQIGKTSRKEWV